MEQKRGYFDGSWRQFLIWELGLERAKVALGVTSDQGIYKLARQPCLTRRMAIKIIELSNYRFTLSDFLDKREEGKTYHEETNELDEGYVPEDFDGDID